MGGLNEMAKEIPYKSGIKTRPNYKHKQDNIEFQKILIQLVKHLKTGSRKTDQRMLAIEYIKEAAECLEMDNRGLTDK
jgi:hypothetical protein